MNMSKQYAWQLAANCRENNPLLPQSLRVQVIGKSGCGKTTVIFNLLLQPDWLEYNHLCIWKESSSTRIQVSQERFRGWFEQAANSQCVQQSRGVGVYITDHCH